MVKRNKEKPPQVAVIGCGYWGKNLIRNYHNLGALKLICDKNEMALADFKSQYADVDTCIALADVLTRKDIEEAKELARKKMVGDGYAIQREGEIIQELLNHIEELEYELQALVLKKSIGEFPMMFHPPGLTLGYTPV